MYRASARVKKTPTFTVDIEVDRICIPSLFTSAL